MQKDSFNPRSKIELVVTEDNDYGMGPCENDLLSRFELDKLTLNVAYWKTGNAQHQSQGDFDPTMKQTEAKAKAPRQIPPKGRNQALIINDSDDSDEIVAYRRGRSRASSRAGSVAPALPKKPVRSTKASGAVNPLFLDSEDEEAIKEEVEAQLVASDDDTQTLMSSAGTTTRSRATRTKTLPKTKKPAPILADDDSDDGVFKGFRSKRKR
jgi:hypothetical protein